VKGWLLGSRFLVPGAGRTAQGAREGKEQEGLRSEVSVKVRSAEGAIYEIRGSGFHLGKQEDQKTNVRDLR
jgi:hypothetical protein